MLNTKRIIAMARRSQKVSALTRRFIKPSNFDGESEGCDTLIAGKGHLFVYTTDRSRFMVPVGYLSSNIFQELFRLSEEFGFPTDGPITLPCNAKCMEYIISLLRKRVDGDVEMNVLIDGRCAASLPSHRHDREQAVLYGY